MEELRSTEVLDREILEDARKKAFKILKTADDTVRSQAQRWEKKTRKAVADIHRNYAQRVEKVKEEIFARLPLDKRRLRSEIAEQFLLEAMENFLGALSRKQLLSVLDREFSERLADCPGLESKAVLFYSGMTVEEAEGIVKNREWELKRDESPDCSKFPALALDAPSARVSASVEKTAMELLEDKRAELAACLLGQGALND